MRNDPARPDQDRASSAGMPRRQGIPALTPRDAAARNIGEVLNFSAPANLTAPRWDVPAVVAEACPAGTAPATPAPVPSEHELTWAAVASLAQASGFPRP